MYGSIVGRGAKRLGSFFRIRSRSRRRARSSICSSRAVSRVNGMGHEMERMKRIDHHLRWLTPPALDPDQSIPNHPTIHNTRLDPLPLPPGDRIFFHCAFVGERGRRPAAGTTSSRGKQPAGCSHSSQRPRRSGSLCAKAHCCWPGSADRVVGAAFLVVIGCSCSFSELALRAAACTTSIKAPARTHIANVRPVSCRGRWWAFRIGFGCGCSIGWMPD